jgi:hypothetical protein
MRHKLTVAAACPNCDVPEMKKVRVTRLTVSCGGIHLAVQGNLSSLTLILGRQAKRQWATPVAVIAFDALLRLLPTLAVRAEPAFCTLAEMHAVAGVQLAHSVATAYFSVGSCKTV